MVSFGWVNFYYIWVDMDILVVCKMVFLQNVDIIVYNLFLDGILWGVVDELGIFVIILEVGNFNIFQWKFICSGIMGIYNVLCYLEMVDDEIDEFQKEIVICSFFCWFYIEMGGLFIVYVDLCE